jgi:hypothetical protein
MLLPASPKGREIHIVADNLSAHKTKNVFEFLQANPTLRIHYTPTYWSWLESGGDLVFQNSTRCHLSGNLHFHDRPIQKVNPLH